MGITIITDSNASPFKSELENKVDGHALHDNDEGDDIPVPIQCDMKQIFLFISLTC